MIVRKFFGSSSTGLASPPNDFILLRAILLLLP